MKKKDRIWLFPNWFLIAPIDGRGWEGEFSKRKKNESEENKSVQILTAFISLLLYENNSIFAKKKNYMIVFIIHFKLYLHFVYTSLKIFE